jgi:type II secretory pathway component GspD/PulD (secretin)
LGDIPLLGFLFRHKDQTKDIERELIVFITPRIIRNKAEVKLAQVKNIQVPAREQAAAAGITRDYIINANMNRFEKKH